MRKEKLFIFICGAVGIIFIEVVRIYKLAVLGETGEYTEQFFIVIPILILIGGSIPVLLKETNRKKAFYFGLTFLTSVSAILGSKDSDELKGQNRLFGDGWGYNQNLTEETNEDTTIVKIFQKIADVLVADESEDVRKFVAWTKYPSDSTIVKLTLDEVDSVRIELAQNENIPSEKIRILTKDKNVSVRLAMADRIEDEQIMMTLAKDKDIRVRTKVAENLSARPDDHRMGATAANILDYPFGQNKRKSVPPKPAPRKETVGFWKKTRLYLGSLF